MQVFFILFILFCFGIFLSVTNTKEYYTDTNPQNQQGNISFFQNEMDRLDVTTSTISVLQDKALSQFSQITRLEASIAIIEAKKAK